MSRIIYIEMSSWRRHNSEDDWLCKKKKVTSEKMTFLMDLKMTEKLGGESTQHSRPSLYVGVSSTKSEFN